jgi:hypothetical protein
MAFGEIYAAGTSENQQSHWPGNGGGAYRTCVFAILRCRLTLSLGCPEGKQGQVEELRSRLHGHLCNRVVRDRDVEVRMCFPAPFECLKVRNGVGVLLSSLTRHRSTMTQASPREPGSRATAPYLIVCFNGPLGRIPGWIGNVTGQSRSSCRCPVPIRSHKSSTAKRSWRQTAR